ncbi:unnamed protein product, partial [Ectocarpus sp. 12 AP-2014]
VERWSRGEDLFTKKFVFIPVEKDMHWSLACFCNLDKIQVRSVYTAVCNLFMPSVHVHAVDRVSF